MGCFDSPMIGLIDSTRFTHKGTLRQKIERFLAILSAIGTSLEAKNGNFSNIICYNVSLVKELSQC